MKTVWIIFNSHGVFLRCYATRGEAQDYIDAHPYGNQFQLAMVPVYEGN